MTFIADTSDGSSRSAETLKNVAHLVLCVLAGFLSAFTVPIVGQLPVGELILIPVFPWVLARAIAMKGWPTRMQQLGWHKLLIYCIGAMALGYVVSDIYRGTSGDNLARGWARVAFLGIDLVSIGYLIDGSWKRLQLFVFSLALGGTVNALLSGPLNGLWWEFGFGALVSLLLLFLVAGRATIVQVCVATALAILAEVLEARSLGGICLLTGALFGLRYARGILRPLAILGLLGSLAAFVVATNEVVFQNVDKEASNVERRSMIETAGEAFISSPLIGQGSWFTASKLISLLEERRERLDPHFHGYSPEEARLVSIHSQLLIALAEGGILGGAFFIAFGALLLKTMRSLTRNPVPHRAFVLYVVIDGLWNVCMSPFSGVSRVAINLGVCTCLLVILQRQGELSDNFRE
jgi:hypothetical protein